LLGDRIYSRDGKPLEAVIGDLLRSECATLSVAESCTGGLIGAKITSVAGSSDYFSGGLVTYQTSMKTRLAGVDAALIDRHGVVSAEVAQAMAEGARSQTGSTYAISITGLAGPGGGTDEVPVGTVVFGFAGPDGSDSRRVQMPGDRELVRQFSAQAALDYLRRKLTRPGKLNHAPQKP
jgi:nicotinamide-nucleotide amidase